MIDAENVKIRPLLNEAEIVQNAALGAVLLWRFLVFYEKTSGWKGVPMPLLFIVLPLLLNEYTRDVITSTKRSSGLHLFSLKMIKRKEELLSIHGRMLRLRLLTLRSISLGVEKGLLQISVVDGLVINNMSESGYVLPNEILSLIKSSDKLGVWCGTLDLTEIQNYLRVRF